MLTSMINEAVLACVRAHRYFFFSKKNTARMCVRTRGCACTPLPAAPDVGGCRGAGTKMPALARITDKKCNNYLSRRWRRNNKDVKGGISTEHSCSC